MVVKSTSTVLLNLTLKTVTIILIAIEELCRAIKFTYNLNCKYYVNKTWFNSYCLNFYRVLCSISVTLYWTLIAIITKDSIPIEITELALIFKIYNKNLYKFIDIWYHYFCLVCQSLNLHWIWFLCYLKSNILFLFFLFHFWFVRLKSQM